MIYDSVSLQNSHVMVVGCGALGNEVLKNLVLMGIGRLTIVDFDVVEMGNLTRSILYRRSDIGNPKVEVARKALLDINPNLEIHCINGDIAHDVGLGTIRRMDIIIGCVDSRWARYCIQRLCLRVGKTWVDGGIINLEGTARVFRPGCSCYACSLGPEGLKELRRRMPCSGIIHRQEQAGHAPTTPIIASVIGAVQAQEAIKILLAINNEQLTINNEQLTINNEQLTINNEQLTINNCDYQKMFYYEGESLTVQTHRFEAWDEDCPLHDEWDIDNNLAPVTLHPSTSLKEAINIIPSQHPTPVSPSADLGGLQHQSPPRGIKGGSNSSLPLGGLRGAPSLILPTPFVDYITRRTTDERYDIMLPAHKVEDFIARHPKLHGCLLSDFYQHEYNEIDDTFPYPDLTLHDIGIPQEDILRFRTPEGYKYALVNKL